jgi:hypothetical protein
MHKKIKTVYQDRAMELRDSNGDWWKGTVRGAFKENGNQFLVLENKDGEWHIPTADINCYKPAPEARLYKFPERELICLKSGTTAQRKKRGTKSKRAAR